MMTLKELEKSIPETDISFYFDDSHGVATGIHYRGDFQMCIMRYQDKMRLRKYLTELNKGIDTESEASYATMQYNYHIAYLKYAIIEGPKWWKDSNCGLELLDDNVVIDLYEKVAGLEKEWMAEVWNNESDDVKKVNNKDEEKKDEEK